MEPKILFEEIHVLVIDKPSGMVVNRAESVKGETVQEWIEGRGTKGTISTTSTKSSDFEKRDGIVHRIDKETSGCLLIAKTPEVFVELQRQFREREVEKSYIALLHGKLEPEEGVIKEPVGRLPWNRERFGVLEEGRESKTNYKVIKLLSYRLGKTQENLSLVEFYPKTGRTHQIRVHAKFIHHPVVGDTFYAGRKTSRRDREWCPRLFLHASEITFAHPKTGKRVKVKSELPQDLQDVLGKLDQAA